MTEGLKVTAITQLQYITSDGAKFDSVHAAVHRELKLYVDKILKEDNVDSEDADEVIDFIIDNLRFLDRRQRQIIEEFYQACRAAEKAGSSVSYLVREE